MPTLRVVSYNVRGLKDDCDALGEVIRGLAPDVLFAQEAPRRLRWRQHCAELARLGGMIYASGGLPGLGNLILVSLRVNVHEAWGLRYPLTPGRHMRGAALARCSVGRIPFLAVGTHLATDHGERPAQAALLAATLRGLAADGGGPVVFGGDLNETDGGIDALFADSSCRVSDYRVVDNPAVRRASDHFPIYAEVEF